MRRIRTASEPTRGVATSGKGWRRCGVRASRASDSHCSPKCAAARTARRAERCRHPLLQQGYLAARGGASRIADLYDCCALARWRDVCFHARAACTFPVIKRGGMAGPGWMLVWSFTFCTGHLGLPSPCGHAPTRGLPGHAGDSRAATVQSSRCHCTCAIKRMCKALYPLQETNVTASVTSAVHTLKASTNSTSRCA